MKKLIFIISLFALMAFASAPPVPTFIYSGYTVTIGTTETEYQFSDLDTSFPKDVTLYIQTASANAGTIQFSSGQTITASFAAVAADKRIPITIRNGYKNLTAKASTSGQIFIVTH